MGIVADTVNGRIEGVELEGGVRRFAAVPYAAPPTGERRFRAPQPVDPWTGTRDATEFGPAAPQVRPVHMPQSEDCLQLNVWTPALEGARPVIVWLHGGGFMSGAARDTITDGAALARTQDVVVVSVTHRLALLGFLDLEGIAGEEFAGSTNASMLDLVAALAWVRDNIASFGGDPGRVTIMGHSGGGGKVATLAAMPAARGLIHRAVVLGGPPFGMHHRSDALESAELALHDLGLTAATAGEIRGMPVERLLETQLRLGVGGAPGPHGMRFSPVAGTADLPVDSYTAFAAGVAADVPFIIGTAVDEAHLVLFARPELADDARDLDRDALVRAVAPGLGDPGQAGDLVDRYRARHPERSLARLFLDIHSDQFRIRSTRLAAARLAGGADATWIYSADVGHDGMPGSYHGIEVPFFFHTLVEADEDPAAGHAPAATEPRRRLQDAVAADLAAFASDGVPGSGQSWPRYGLAEPRQVLLSDDGAVHRLERYATDVDELWHGVPAPITTDPWTTLF